ncbi:hypothetical protein [Abiotrophia defectiva]
MNLKNKKKITWRLILWMISQLIILILISLIAYTFFFSTLSKETIESLLYIIMGGASGIILACADLMLYNKIQEKVDSNGKFGTFFAFCLTLTYSAFLTVIIWVMAFVSPEISSPLQKGLLALIILFELSKKLAEIRNKPQPNTIMIPCDRGDIKVELSPNGSGPELDFTKPQQFIFTSDDKTVKIHITSQDK